MTQFVIILYEAAIIYDRWCGTAQHGAARRVLRERELYRAHRGENYLISDAAGKSPKSRDDPARSSSAVYCAIVEKRASAAYRSRRADNLLAAASYSRVAHEEEVKDGRLREAHVLQAWHH